MIKAEFDKLHLQELNLGCSTGNQWFAKGQLLTSLSPVDGRVIAQVKTATKEDYEEVMERAKAAFLYWRDVPAPHRGELIRQLGNKLRSYKTALGKLVSYEMGKSLQEGLGEVQEMIDICDFAVGLSRQLYGNTIHSERPEHRMYDQYHPLGVVGIITAFNFPVAVWAWNATLALVCGNVIVWKPSEKTPICAVACQQLLNEVLQDNNYPEGLSNLLVADSAMGKLMAEDPRINLLSATGSTNMGKSVAVTVAARLGKYLLELGGNNAIIISPTADLKMTVLAAVFGAVGTAGQRCTTTRRLIVHKSILPAVKEALVKAYSQLKIGNPLDATNHVGPLIDQAAVDNYLAALNAIKEQGGTFLIEGAQLEGFETAYYVQPAIAEVENHFPIVQQETFAPILYLIPYEGEIQEAIEIQNSVAQGLSSAIMTTNIREAELFLSASGSDCGIANVNIGTSGAEIGGAFGGEKDTGGGRESGSDAWKTYMRRQTNTINYSTTLPLAQGIKFDL